MSGSLIRGRYIKWQRSLSLPLPHLLQRLRRQLRRQRRAETRPKWQQSAPGVVVVAVEVAAAKAPINGAAKEAMAASLGEETGEAPKARAKEAGPATLFNTILVTEVPGIRACLPWSPAGPTGCLEAQPNGVRRLNHLPLEEFYKQPMKNRQTQNYCKERDLICD